MYDIVNLILI
jgi:hypothetical protein